MGSYVEGADVSITPEELRSLSSSMSSSKESFDAAIAEIDAEIKQMAGTAMGADSPEYQAFIDTYTSVMKPKAEEISEQLERHAKNASATSDSGDDMINKNVGTFNNLMGSGK